MPAIQIGGMSGVGRIAGTGAGKVGGGGGVGKGILPGNIPWAQAHEFIGPEAFDLGVGKGGSFSASGLPVEEEVPGRGKRGIPGGPFPYDLVSKNRRLENATPEGAGLAGIRGEGKTHIGADIGIPVSPLAGSARPPGNATTIRRPGPNPAIEYPPPPSPEFVPTTIRRNPVILPKGPAQRLPTTNAKDDVIT